jgi:hypothetical protein
VWEGISLVTREWPLTDPPTDKLIELLRDEVNTVSKLVEPPVPPPEELTIRIAALLKAGEDTVTHPVGGEALWNAILVPAEKPTLVMADKVTIPGKVSVAVLKFVYHSGENSGAPETEHPEVNSRAVVTFRLSTVS